MSFRLLVLFMGFSLFLGAQGAEAQVVEAPVQNCRDGKPSFKLFEDRPWFDPLPAAPHEPQTLLLFSKSKRMPFTSGPTAHSTLEASIGLDAPILSFDGPEGGKPIGAKCWGAGMWLSASIPLALDFTESGQPVLDTDYIPAIAGKIAYGLSDKTRLGFLIQYGHESDHLSWDAVQNNFGSDFEWVDINFEFWKLGVNLEREFSRWVVSGRLTTRIIATRGHQGFYSYGHRRPNGLTLMPSERNWEPAVGLQVMPNRKSGWGLYGSGYAGGDTVYDYNKTTPGQKEKTRVSQSYLVGLRNFNHDGLRIDPVINYFIGRNPYGMFRNQNTWWSLRVGVLIHR